MEFAKLSQSQKGTSTLGFEISVLNGACHVHLAICAFSLAKNFSQGFLLLPSQSNGLTKQDFRAPCHFHMFFINSLNCTVATIHDEGLVVVNPDLCHIVLINIFHM